MAQILRKWSPDPTDCPYCETLFRWDESDVVFHDKAGFIVNCPTCSYEISIKKLPMSIQDAAIERAKRSGRFM